MPALQLTTGRALLLPQGLLWLPIVRSLSLILKAAPESDAAGCFGSPLQGPPFFLRLLLRSSVDPSHTVRLFLGHLSQDGGLVLPTLALNSWVQMILAPLPWPPEKRELLADISFLLALNKNWFRISTSFPHHRGASQHCSPSCSSVAHAMSHPPSNQSLPKPPASAVFSHRGASSRICCASPFYHRLTCSGLFI